MEYIIIYVIIIIDSLILMQRSYFFHEMQHSCTRDTCLRTPSRCPQVRLIFSLFERQWQVQVKGHNFYINCWDAIVVTRGAP